MKLKQSYNDPAKHEAYGFDKITLELIYSYFKNRKQRVKFNLNFRT